MAVRRQNGSTDFVYIPVLPLEYLYAPTHWPMADGTNGKDRILGLNHKIMFSTKLDLTKN